MRRALIPGLAVTAAVAVAGCGSSSSETTSKATTPSSASASSSETAATAPLKLASANGVMGKVIVDDQGRTVYVLTPETTAHLLCTSSGCLAAWPPVTVKSAALVAHAGEGVTGHLGVLKRSDGTLQVTLDGHPLYVYVGDHESGQAAGEDLKSFGGTWEAVTASGKSAAAGESSSSSSGGY